MNSLHSQFIHSAFTAWRAMSRGGQCLRSLERSQWLSGEQIAEQQWARLSTMLQHAYDAVPYYRDLFASLGAHPRDIKTAADLRRIPTIDKATINAHRASLVSSRCSRRSLIANETGGSTGEPVRFYQDRQYWAWARAGQFRAFHMTGWRPGDRWAFFWGARHEGMLQTGWRRVPNFLLGNLHWTNAYCITEAQLQHAFDQLETFRPKLLVGYVSSLVMLCRYMQVKNLCGRLRVPSVMPSAETLSPDDRILIETTLGAAVFNRYGARECSIVAQECDAHEGLHVWSETNYLELLDGEHPAGAGQPGRAVVTSLTNFTMPLIRYELADVATQRRGVCSCGRGLPLLQNVAGRIYEHLVMPSGKLVSGGAVTHLLYRYESIKQYQVTQHAAGAITVRIVPVSGEVSPELERQIRHAFADRLDRDLVVKVEACETIEPGASGKYSYVRSEVLPPFAKRHARYGETS